MIDIHSHLLPDVDDGPDSMAVSLAMIRRGVAEGITEAVVTPHVPEGALNADTDARLCRSFEELTRSVGREGIAIRLHLGSEIMYQFGIEAIARMRAGTLAGNGRYFLIETPLGFFPPTLEDTLFRTRVRGQRPILAHPERYVFFWRHPDAIDRLLEQGILLQVNATSLSGRTSSPVGRLALSLVETGRAHFVASDAHDPVARPFSLRNAYEIVCGRWGNEVGDRLFVEHPSRAISGEEIECSPPTEPSKQTGGGFLQRLLRSL